MLEDVGPGTDRLCELGPGDELLLVGPLGNGFSAAARAAPAAARRRRGGDRASGDLQDATPAAGVGAAGLPRRRSRRRRDSCSRDAQVATDDGSVGHHGLVTELLEA